MKPVFLLIEMSQNRDLTEKINEVFKRRTDRGKETD